MPKYFKPSKFFGACIQSPRTLNTVKSILSRGASPDVLMRENHAGTYETGLHIATCPELVQLLIEFGADVDKKNSDGMTPIEVYFKPRYARDKPFNIECICLLIELGANVKNIDMEDFRRTLHRQNSIFDTSAQFAFLECVIRLTEVNVNLVSEQLKKLFLRIAEPPPDGWDPRSYENSCSEEVKCLSNLGLRHILDDEVMVKPYFESKFGSLLGTIDLSPYPIYGKMLKIKMKRKLLECKKKGKIMPRAVPQLQRLFRSLCDLPYLAAEAILWHFRIKELDQFVKKSFWNQV